MSTHIKFRAFARGAGKAVTVFPRANMIMTPTSAADDFIKAKSLISSASKKAERSIWSRRELAHAE